MARAASRCSLVLSNASGLPSFLSVDIQRCLRLCQYSAVTPFQLASASHSRTTNNKRCHSHSSSPAPATQLVRYHPDRNVSTSQVTSLLDGIKHAESVEKLLSLVSANKARLSESHIAEAFSALVTHRHLAVDQMRFNQYVTSQREFTTLSDLAENRVSTFDDSLLINVLYCSIKLHEYPSHPLTRELRNEALRRLDQLKTPQLSKMAVCLGKMGEERAPSMGLVANAYSRILDETKHFRELSSFMKESSALLSGGFKSRIVRLLKVFLSSDDLAVSKPSSGNYRKVFTCIDRFTNDYQSILDKCASIMQDGVEETSTREICLLLFCITNPALDYSNPHFVGHLKDLLYGRLTSIEDPSVMAMTITLLGSKAPAHIKFQLEENAMRLVDSVPASSIGNLCHGLYRMGYFSHTPLHDKIMDRLQVVQSELTLDVLLPLVGYYKHLTWMDKEQWKPIESWVHELTIEQVLLSKFIRGVHILSLIPTFSPNDQLLERVQLMLPQLQTYGADTHLLAMKRMVGRMAREDISPLCREVSLAIQTHALMSLRQNTCPDSLLKLLESVFVEGADLELVDAIFQQLSKTPITRFGAHHAVNCARRLYKARYFDQDLLDRIVEVTLPNINKVTPVEALTLMSPYCSLNYQPKQSEEFFRACTQRVIPFLEKLPGGFLVDMAWLMGCNQLFPEEILSHIFSLKFLTKLDEELEGLPNRSDMYRRKLMFLNRAVSLECPELQVPWFHEKYCQALLKKRQLFIHQDIKEVQTVLVEVLGGAQYLRSFITTPYYYTITFECILDASGSPMTCANYGNSLDHRNGLSGSVLSDLMQWDTQSIQLPEGAQRVAIDYLFSNVYCVNSGRTLGLSTMKKRHLELLGYQYIQIPFFEWKSLHLTGQEEKKEYLQMKIFSSSSSGDLNQTDIASAPSSFQEYIDNFPFGPLARWQNPSGLNGRKDLAVAVVVS